MRVLFIGDISGDSGINAVYKYLPQLKIRENIDITIANGENSADGFGITKKTHALLTKAGIDAFTMGNHIWSKKDIFELFTIKKNIVCPLNLPLDDPGPRALYLEAPNGEILAVVSVLGRVFNNMSLSCPLRSLERMLPALTERTPCILVDVHAETTSEKSVLAWCFDGSVSAILGTHTHVQTADERLLPEGTAFISDVGMCGALDSVIGVKKELAIARFKSTLPNRFETAQGDFQFNACVIDINSKTGRAIDIKRINISTI